MRRIAITLAILVVPPVSQVHVRTLGQGQNFVLVEEARLPPDTEQPGTSTLDIDLVDVDGDADLDIYKAQGTDSLDGRPNQLLINTGSGVFVDESAVRLPPEILNSTKADWGDVDGDGDGDLDILVSNEVPFPGAPGAQSRLWINDGLGQFTDQTVLRLPSAIEQTVAMLPGDIDGDGDLDLIVLNRGQDKVLINSGAGIFTDETSLRFPDRDDTSRAGGLADLDGDGDLDLVVGNSRGEAAALYFNDGVGRFFAGDPGMTPLPNETIAGLELVDLDEDGDLDVYLSNAGQLLAGHGFLGGPDRYFRNNGRGRFEERTTSHFVPPNDPTTDAAFGDIDGDGDLDLVVGNSGENGGERVFVQYPCAHGRCDIRVE